MSVQRTGTVFRVLPSLLAAMAGCCGLGTVYADATDELDDAAARLQYAFFTADVRHLEDALALIDRLEVPATLAAMKEYHAAYGQWKLAQLYADRAARNGGGPARAAANKAAQACVKRAAASIKLDQRLDEAYAIDAVCSSFEAGPRTLSLFSGCARSKSLRTALELGPDNPRVKFIEAICLDGNDVAVSTAQFDKLREAIRTFESAPPSLPGKPDWGQAEALVLLGQSYLQRGDSVAARDAIERALVLAPDYRKAQELLQAAAARPK